MEYLNNKIHNKEKLTKDDIFIMYPIRWTIQEKGIT
jgi:hypothetical protein